MNFSMPGAFLMCLTEVLPEAQSRMFDETAVGAALLLAVAGMALRIYVPRLQIATEEHVKDGKLTPDEARRQVRFYEVSATVVTLLGVSVLGLVLFDMAS
jgi:hypothetical protein